MTSCEIVLENRKSTYNWREEMKKARQPMWSRFIHFGTQIKAVTHIQECQYEHTAWYGNTEDNMDIWKIMPKE